MVSLTGFITFLERSLGSDDLMLLHSGKARDKLFSLVGRLSELTQGKIGRIFDASEEKRLGLRSFSPAGLRPQEKNA
ncbi:MAG: hypothetical protein FGF48_06735 [Candidatus Brockarchaeota archaeon]|nr:hypothetical protein [Candidatus Brockarchaeota archaeon]